MKTAATSNFRTSIWPISRKKGPIDGAREAEDAIRRIEPEIYDLLQK
jgi:hypothetical protein